MLRVWPCNFFYSVICRQSAHIALPHELLRRAQPLDVVLFRCRMPHSVAQRLITRPMAVLVPFEEALRNVVRATETQYAKEAEEIDFRVSLVGMPYSLTPRELKSSLLCSLVNVEGIVTKCSLVRPKIVKSAHYCVPRPGANSQPGDARPPYLMYREYRDATSFEGMPTPATYPTKDEDGTPLETEFGKCMYKDHQTVVIQPV